MSAKLDPAAFDSFVARVAERATTIDVEAAWFPDLMEEAARIGLQSLLFDADLQVDLSATALVQDTTERIAAHSPAVALAVSVPRLHTYLLARYAGQHLRDRWIRPTLAAEVYGSFGITEPHAGTDVRAMTTVARRDGDEYVLDGAKCWIGLAPIASYSIVLAKVDSDDRSAPTIALVVDLSADGVTTGHSPELAGFRGMPNGTLEFRGCRVPVADALDCDGFAGMMDGLNMARIEAASYALGIMRGALALSSEWATVRPAGTGTIGDLPSIQAKLGRMATDYRAARELVLRAGESYAEGGGGDPTLISMAKMFASDVARRATDETLQIFAGTGMTREHPAQRMDRDVKITQIFDGTSEIHETMIGRRAVREAGRGGLGQTFLPTHLPEG